MKQKRGVWWALGESWWYLLRHRRFSLLVLALASLEVIGGFIESGLRGYSLTGPVMETGIALIFAPLWLGLSTPLLAYGFTPMILLPLGMLLWNRQMQREGVSDPGRSHAAEFRTLGVLAVLYSLYVISYVAQYFPLEVEDSETEGPLQIWQHVLAHLPRAAAVTCYGAFGLFTSAWILKRVVGPNSSWRNSLRDVSARGPEILLAGALAVGVGTNAPKAFELIRLSRGGAAYDRWDPALFMTCWSVSQTYVVLCAVWLLCHPQHRGSVFLGGVRLIYRHIGLILRFCLVCMPLQAILHVVFALGSTVGGRIPVPWIHLNIIFRGLVGVWVFIGLGFYFTERIGQAKPAPG